MSGARPSGLLRVRILRSAPSAGQEARFQEYAVEAGRRMTVLQLLEEIYRRQDGSLAFRRSCGFGKCGVCAVRVDGRPVLACRQLVEGGSLRLEPLAGHRVVRDLVVEWD